MQLLFIVWIHIYTFKLMKKYGEKSKREIETLDKQKISREFLY